MCYGQIEMWIRGKPARGAVTLVEMLVAMFITSLISVVLWNLFGSGSRAAAYGTWHSSRVQELRQCLRMVREDLSKATYKSEITPTAVTVHDTAADSAYFIGHRPGQTNLPGTVDFLDYHICRPDRTAMPENVQPADIRVKLSANVTTLHYERSSVSGAVKPEDLYDRDVVRDVMEVEIKLTPQVTGDTDGSQAKGDSTGTLSIRIKCRYPTDPSRFAEESTTCKLNLKWRTI